MISSFARKTVKTVLPIALILLAQALSSCAELGPDARVSGVQQGPVVQSQPAGTNQVGEACRYEPIASGLGHDLARGFNVFCGTWQQASGRIFEAATTVAPEQLGTVTRASPWRTALDQVFSCGEPTPSTILKDTAAQLVRCTRRNGGWPQLALVADVAGKTYFVDGVPSALPALESVLATLSGQAVPREASATMTEITAAISSHPFGSGDLDSYFMLMRLGNVANDGSDYAAAEQAFRGALAIQERVLGPNDPGLATPLMDLSLQISNEGRFLEADQLMARARDLVTELGDELLTARYDVYLGEHEANRGELDKAEASASRAEQEYLDIVPPSLVAAARGTELSQSASYVDSLMLGPDGQNAVSGLAASWALDALIAYRKADYSRLRSLDTSIDRLLSASGLRPPGIEPRVLRLAALGDARGGDATDAVVQLGQAADLFAKYGANERPVAITLFLAARSALGGSERERALALFRRGADLARARHVGLPDYLVGDYLNDLDAAASDAGADRQAIASEMFQASQLIEGNVTGQVVAQAFARLAAGDAKTRDLLRRMQDADLKLRQLYARRDQESQLPADQTSHAELAKIDAEIAEAQATRAAADAAAQSASPDYARLVSKEATVAAVQHVLAPHEGLISFVISPKATFVILVERERVDEYKIALSDSQLAQAVTNLRNTIVPSEGLGEVRLPVFDVPAAHRLYEALLGPVDERLQALDRLVIIPSGALTSLPLETLVTADTPAVTNGNYKDVPFLIKRLAISYIPSPETLVVLRQNTKPSAAPNPYIGFGDFKPASRQQIAATFPPGQCTRDFLAFADLDPLPGTRKEVTVVGKLVFHVPDEDIVLGGDFTKPRLMSMDLTKYRIIHLAAHALLPSELRCRSEPLIVMSADPAAPDASGAILGLSDVLSLKLDADIVLLSACNTAGPGVAGASDSLSGLAKAFFFAGARGLMVTHWELEDTAGPILTALTLSPPGTSIRDSATDLQRAKLYMIVALGNRPGPGFAFFTHPFAWAPFVLIGDGIRATSPTS